MIGFCQRCKKFKWRLLRLVSVYVVKGEESVFMKLCHDCSYTKWEDHSVLQHESKY